MKTVLAMIGAIALLGAVSTAQAASSATAGSSINDSQSATPKSNNQPGTTAGTPAKALPKKSTAKEGLSNATNTGK